MERDSRGGRHGPADDRVGTLKWMLYLLVSFFVAAGVTLLVIHSARSHAHISADSDLDGPQKFHATPVPRIGGVGMFGGK